MPKAEAAARFGATGTYRVYRAATDTWEEPRPMTVRGERVPLRRALAVLLKRLFRRNR